MVDRDIESLVEEIRSAQLPEPAERRQIRDKANVTIREAARILRVAPMTFLRWERGESTPNRDNAVMYRRFLDSLSAVVAA